MFKIHHFKVDSCWSIDARRQERKEKVCPIRMVPFEMLHGAWFIGAFANEFGAWIRRFDAQSTIDRWAEIF
jgi:hypothetical protein